MPAAMNLADKLGPAATVDASLSDLARGVVGSEILRIAAEIRAAKAKGAQICNLTVGDFDPSQFPAPDALLDGMRKALAAGETNYPPSDGVVGLREAVAAYYAEHLGLSYPVESCSSPAARGRFSTVRTGPWSSRGRVVYPVPSWNNNHYAYLCGARAVEIPCARRGRSFSPPPTTFARTSRRRACCSSTRPSIRRER